MAAGASPFEANAAAVGVSREVSFLCRVRFPLTVSFVALALLPLYRSGVRPPALRPIERLTAEATLQLLGAAGVPVAREGAVLRSPRGFALDVHLACTGWFAVALFTAGVLAMPRVSPLTLVSGAFALVVLNLLRLAFLFWAGATHPAAFAVMHRWVGEALMVTAVICGWLGHCLSERGRPCASACSP